MKKIYMGIFVFAMSLFVSGSILVSPVPALALTVDDAFGGTAVKDTIETNIGLGNKDPREIAADIIKVILGFLGIIAVVIILLGGFKWMTAGGNEDKIEEAKKMITAGVIGLVIILAAFGIATFVISSLLGATGA